MAHAARALARCAAWNASCTVVSVSSSARSPNTVAFASRAWRSFVACAVVIGLSGCVEDVGALREANERTRAMARDTLQAEAARRALDSLAAAYPAREGLRSAEATERDTLVARVLARRAFVTWVAGDTAGAFVAYVQALPSAPLLGDSARAELLRSAAYVAQMGPSPGAALELLDTAERVARSAGENDLAAVILRCKAWVLADAEGVYPCPEPSRQYPTGLLLLAATLLATLGLVFVLHRRALAVAEAHRAVVAHHIRAAERLAERAVDEAARRRRPGH